MEKINIIVILTKKLINRTNYLNSSLLFLKNTIEKNNYICEINVIDSPDEKDINENIELYNSKINYEKEGNEVYDKLIQGLTINQISNMEKHKKGLEIVDEKSINLIIEDDLIISKEYIENIEKIFNKILKNKNIDILILSDFIYNNNDLELVNYNNYKKILISKSSYIINKKTADRLKQNLEIFKYDMKTLLSKFMDENKDLNKYMLNKCTFLEGSKIGLFLSSTKSKNFLSQNSEFIELVKITNKENITQEDYNIGENIYKNLDYLNNADIQHLFGILNFKYKNIDLAKKYMTLATLNLKKNLGYISKSHEILNNTINIYKYDQLLLNDCKNNISKYGN